MNINYAKAILYAYPNLDKMSMHFDDLIERKALSSFCDFSPCVDQCEIIISLMNKKTNLINLKLTIDDILSKLSQYEIDLLDYKYFKSKSSLSFSRLDTTSRTYFRRQIKILDKFAYILERKGINDNIFIDKYLSINLFRSLYNRVLERENTLKSYRKKYVDFIPKNCNNNRRINRNYNIVK